MRRLSLAAIVLISVAACGSPTPSGLSSTPEAARAVDASGAYTLTFELPTTTWKAGEPITGEAQLAIARGADTSYGSADGPLNFSYRELTGHRQMGPAWDAVCAHHDISAAAPITSPLTECGAWDESSPDGAFYTDFFTSAGIRLTAGDWSVTAFASFSIGHDCSVATTDLEAPIVIHVID